MSEIDNIITSLERQKAAIDTAIAALREIGGTEPKTRRGRPPGGTKARKRTRNISPEGRQRQIEAMRRYWAQRKAGGKTAARKTSGKKRAAKKTEEVAERANVASD